MSDHLVEVEIVKIDVSENEEIATHFDVSALPRFILYSPKTNNKAFDDYTGSDINIIKEKFVSIVK